MISVTFIMIGTKGEVIGVHFFSNSKTGGIECYSLLACSKAEKGLNSARSTYLN